MTRTCSVPGCGRDHYALGRCRKHWEAKRLGRTRELYVKPPRRCSVAGCDRDYRSNGFCQTHLIQWQRRRRAAQDAHSDPAG